MLGLVGLLVLRRLRSTCSLTRTMLDLLCAWLARSQSSLKSLRLNYFTRLISFALFSRVAWFALLWLVCEDCAWLAKLASFERTMLYLFSLLGLCRLRLARSLAELASLARIEFDLACCLFGWRSLVCLICVICEDCDRLTRSRGSLARPLKPLRSHMPIRANLRK